MTDKERAKKLRTEADRYYLMDMRWRDNYRARLHRLAGKHDASSPTMDLGVLILLDHAAHMIGTRPRWGNER